jgi:GTP-binding protein HflX
VDVNHPSLEDHINVVNQTLADIDASDKPTLLVFNKVDLLEEEEELSVEEKIEQLKNTYLNMESFSDKDEIVFISATNKSNIEELRGKLRKLVEEKHFTIFPNYLKNTYY